MSEAIQGKKRNDIEIALLSILSPIIIIGLIAKTLITDFRQPKAKQPQQKIKNTPTEQDGIEFSPIPIEDEQVIAK